MIYSTLRFVESYMCHMLICFKLKITWKYLCSNLKKVINKRVTEITTITTFYGEKTLFLVLKNLFM